MTSTQSSGRFVWHELATAEVKKATAFYSEIFGWSASEENMGPGGMYTMLKLGSTGVGGITALTPAEKMPSHWRMYCSVPDVDAAAAKAKDLGGKVAFPPTDIPTVGRFAVVVDPQGAALLPFLPLPPENAVPEPEVPPNGTFCWDELLTTDPAKAAAFYTAIYGWTVTEQEMGGGTYRVLKRGERMTGGIMKLPMPGIPPHWGTYVAVASVEETLKRAESLKAKAIVPPTDIPGMGRFATFADPTGATLSVFTGK